MITNTKFSIDDLFEYLGYTGSFQDREKKFLADHGYANWDKLLTAKGFTKGGLADRQKAWIAQSLLVFPARRNRGYAIVPQNVDMVIVR